MNRLQRLRSAFSYANVMATIAVFVALGGTGYAAISLPRDSVGSRELRSRSVGSSEMQRNAVASSSVRDGSLGVRDLSATAREQLQGTPGPAGPAGQIGAAGPKGDRGPQGAPGESVATDWAIINDIGEQKAGNALWPVQQNGSTGESIVTFSHSVAGCLPVATPAKVPGGFNSDPAGASITVETTGDGKVRVRTFHANGSPQIYGFHLIVVCP